MTSPQPIVRPSKDLRSATLPPFALPIGRMNRASARILFVNHTAEIGGPSHSLLMLVRHLRDRYDIAVLLPEDGALCELLSNEGIGTFVIPTLRARTVHRIFRLLRREGIDLVYGNSPSGCSRNAMLAAKLARIPFIWHFRSVKWHWTWRQAFFLRWADELVAVSQACAEPLKRFYPRDIRVIHNGVELASFDGDRAASRRYLAGLLDLPLDAKHIAAVSNLRPVKGYEHAVAVVAQLAQDRANFHLLVAGDLDLNASYTNRIRTIIQRQGLADRIHLLGLIKNIPQLLNGSDVFLHTSNSEAHPRSIIEAMAAGLPVVAFAVDGVAETVVDGDTGYLFSVGDVTGMTGAVRSLLKAPAQAAEMGKRGREFVRSHFTAARTAAQVAQVIEGQL